MTTNKPTGNNGCEALQGDLKAYSDGELSPRPAFDGGVTFVPVQRLPGNDFGDGKDT